MKYFLQAAALFIITEICFAGIYQWVDSQGNRHYSDRPQPDAEVVTIHPGYSYQKVKKVYDGDTVLLMNGQRVRLLGINTPEVAGRHKSVEPGGEEARRWLIEQLKNKKIRLERDVERKDKYGRTLAQVFTEEGVHLNLELVKAGLASVNIHPPNLKYVDEFLAMQEAAENADRGIWAEKYYASQSHSQIKGGNHKGWKRITGVVKKIKKTRRNTYLQFSDDFAIKIEKKFMDLFPALEHYRGEQVEVRGWVNKSKKNYTMTVRHPGSIKIEKY